MTIIDRLTERIHRQHHGDTCDDIHPLVHADHMAGFRRRAERWVDKHAEAKS